MKQPRILLYDIETSPNLSYTWGKWEQNVIDFHTEWEMLSFAFKWLGESKITCISRPDFADKTDKSLIKALWKLIDEADIVIAHNGDEFDNKKANARFLAVGLPPPAPYKSVDTKKVAKAHFKFNSNSLDDLGRTLGVGRKVKHSGFDLWLGCMSGKKASWDEMCKYNKQDVALLERVYLKLQPWIAKHPNVSFIVDRPNGCPKCGHAKLEARGYTRTSTNTYRKFVCKSCGGWCRSRVSENKVKPKVVNL